MRLKNKRILITAGPTWVPIDRVRVISNIATGQTGILLSDKLQSLGAEVTLLLGAVEARCLNKKIKLIHFRFFDELRRLISRELETKRYEIVIHSAAVSDYRPSKTYFRKVKSGLKNWRVDLVPATKIIDVIKRMDKSLCLVGFKFEPEATGRKLIREAETLLARNSCDLVVANTVNKNRYQAFILHRNKIYGPLKNKKTLVQGLIRILTRL